MRSFHTIRERRVIRYEMKRWTKKGVKNKKKKEKREKRAWKLRAYRFIFLKQRMAYSLPTNSNLETYQAGGSTYFARHRRIANTNTYSLWGLDSRMKTTKYIYIYIFISAFQISGVKKKGRKKKFFSISLAAWQYSRIYLKRVESSRERGSRQRTVALDEG